jgi:uncharacterized membrane protein (Fun14 family)
MFPQILISLISAVLPKLAPGTPSAGIVISPSAANTSLLNIVVGAVLAGIGAAGGSDTIHLVSAGAGVLLVGLSWLNHMGVVSASNSNTEALVEDLLKQIADAKST